jgi:hypothetical protein
LTFIYRPCHTSGDGDSRAPGRSTSRPSPFGADGRSPAASWPGPASQRVGPALAAHEAPDAVIGMMNAWWLYAVVA